MSSGSRAAAWRLRQAVGLVAAFALGGLGLVVATPGGVRGVGVVAADQTFRFTGAGAGRYMWTLESGRPAAGSGVVRERSLQIERSELLEASVAPGLATGDVVPADATIAELASGRADLRVIELMAGRAQITAERALLLAGGRPEAIEAARRGVDLAQAKAAEVRASLERMRALIGTGAVSDEEVQAAELADTAAVRAVAVATSLADAAEKPARAEEIAAIDARLAAADARVAEVEAQVEGRHVRTPIRGVVEVGGDALVRVYDLDPVYVRVGLPVAARADVRPGGHARFQSSGAPGRRFDGEVAEVAESIAFDSAGNGILYVTIEVANPDHALSAGMVGTAEMDHDRAWLGRLATLTGSRQ